MGKSMLRNKKTSMEPCASGINCTRCWHDGVSGDSSRAHSSTGESEDHSVHLWAPSEGVMLGVLATCWSNLHWPDINRSLSGLRVMHQYINCTRYLNTRHNTPWERKRQQDLFSAQSSTRLHLQGYMKMTPQLVQARRSEDLIFLIDPVTVLQY